MDAHLDGKVADGTEIIYDADGTLGVNHPAFQCCGCGILFDGWRSAGPLVFVCLRRRCDFLELCGLRALDCAQIAVTDVNGQTTRFEYDAAGYKTAVIDPLATDDDGLRRSW